MKRILSFDFGASNGRAILFWVENNRLCQQEVHRFDNTPIVIDNTLCWDIESLTNNLYAGIKKAGEKGGFDALGIDTWGVDFALIGLNRKLIENPVHYRDSRTDKIENKVFERISPEELYSRCGTQFNRINTLYQLAYLAYNRNDILEKTDKILMMADYFAYLLTGEMRLELTNASTTNLLDPGKMKIDTQLCDILGIPSRLFAVPILPGESYGNISLEICGELGCKPVPVIAAATHDTASAVAAIPSADCDSAFISCGTWSLFGTLLDKPLLCDEARKANFTNEVGYGGKIRFLKNITGSWLLQEYRRDLEKNGISIDYQTLEKEAEKELDFDSVIDTDSPEFFKAGDFRNKVKNYCINTNQVPPETVGEYVVCIYKSIAAKYKDTLGLLRKITGKNIDSISMIGGGIRSELLCNLTAAVCGINVIAGPVEATAIGNAVVCLIGSGEISDFESAKKLIQNSVETRLIFPD